MNLRLGVLPALLLCLVLAGCSLVTADDPPDSSIPALSALPATEAIETPEASPTPSIGITRETPAFEPGKTYVAFTFDDGCITDYTLLYNAFKERGVVGTTYIIPGFIDQRKQDYLSWDQVEEMFKGGWEFGCHTYMHNNVTLLSDEELNESMQKVDKAFTEHGMPAPEIHAFPFGKYNDRTVEIIEKYRVQLRKAFYDDKVVDFADIDARIIDSVSADFTGEKRMEGRKAILDKLSEKGGVIVFRTHGLYKKERDEFGKWVVQTDYNLLMKLVDYAIDKDCEFITMTQLEHMLEERNK